MARWDAFNVRIIQLLILSLLVVPNITIANNDAISKSGNKSTSQRKASTKYAKWDSPQASANKFSFRKTSWGMSPAEVKTSESAEFIPSDVKQVGTERVGGMPTEVAGFSAGVDYIFVDGKLIGGVYSFNKHYSNLNKHFNDFSTLKKLLVKQYGEPQRAINLWSSGQYNVNSQNWNLAVQRGDLTYIIQWKTASTSIELICSGYDSKVYHKLVYQPADRMLNARLERPYTHYDTVLVGYMTYKVMDAEWSRSLSSNEYLDQWPNAEYLSVTLTARNNDGTARMVPPFKLVDEQGAEYESSSKVWARSDSFDLETLNPSVVKQGIAIFDVPSDRQYRLKVSGGYWSEEYAYIQLHSRPSPYR